MRSEAARQATEAVFRMELPRLVAGLVRDVGLAEELAHDAVLVVLEAGPAGGVVPESSGAWLTTAAKNRALDLVKRGKLAEKKLAALGYDLAGAGLDVAPAIEDALDDDDVGDDLLRLVLAACHPVLSTEARVPFEVPPGAALAERLHSVLDVVYLVYDEGYAATSGAHWTRPAPCDDALRLARAAACAA